MKRRTTITQVQPGSLIPADEPKRYQNADGYIRLRWKVAPYTYLECYEHRVIDGRVVPEDVERHHINRIRDDNRPENLVSMTPEEHDREHASDVVDDIVRLYRQGHSTVAVGRMVNRDPAVVYRHLLAQGAVIRNRQRPTTQEERQHIARLFREGRTWADIAQITGRSTHTLAAVRRLHAQESAA